MTETKKLHVALFPWLAFGHTIPYLKVAKHIAQKGHKISFISTPRNIQRLPKIPPNLSSNIHFISLPLPQVDNLPPDAEATMDIPTNKIPYLKIAYDGLKEPLFQFLKTSAPDWIIYDFAAYWLPPITSDLGISSAFFSIFSAWTMAFLASSSSAMINGDDERTRPEDFTVPPKWVPFPSKVAYRIHEAKRAFEHFEVNDSGLSDMYRLGTVMAAVDVLAVRSCFELEADHLKLFEQLHGKPVLPIGLLPPSDLDVTGGDDETWLKICGWLDKQNKGSVVYIAFGSELEVSQKDLNDLALGLELSGLPFFWTLRKQGNSFELPDGFEERVKGRGIVWTSWVPQLRILGHESVGGFLTHCGLSSVVEALNFGLALILFPVSIDQGLNARVFEEKKLGVEVKRNEQDGSFTKESLAESLMLAMDNEKGKLYRESTNEMRKLITNREVHNGCIDQFVEFLQTHRVGSRE
ncbi:hypothetical protein JCGZ_18714 [Jatropha curcas]|uniref:Glycosyltransferase n=1 Tax=Jatropha curcas TaxID=180498 RepID=A0A067KD81_JATCU|nr:hypothetical protein JCGZ_18714 [Jatropha curcas]